MRNGQNKVTGKYNPFRAKIKSLSKIYWGLIAFSLIGAVLFDALISGLFGAKLQGILLDIYLFFIMPGSIALVMLIPYICYIVYLSKRAKIYDEENKDAGNADNDAYCDESVDYIQQEQNYQSEPEFEDEVNNTNPNYISMVQEIKYTGHEQKDYGPWWTAFMGTFVFPPLGIYIILMKTITDPIHYLENSVVLKSVGKTLTVIGLIIIGLSYKVWVDTDNVPFLVYIFTFAPIIIGIYSYILGVMARKKGYDIAFCQKLIWVDGVLELFEISKHIGLNYIGTVRKIQDYINKGFLQSCFIDYKLKTVVVPLQFEKVAIKCKKCGGTTVKIKGTTSICSFCGRNI